MQSCRNTVIVDLSTPQVVVCAPCCSIAVLHPCSCAVCVASGERDALLAAARVGEEVPRLPHVSVVEVGEEGTLLTHKKQLARAKAVEQGRCRAEDVGCHGLSCIVRHLPYVRYDRQFLLPIAHAGLHGLVADIMKLVTCGKPVDGFKLQGVAKERAKDRFGHMLLTCDYGRRPKCMFQHLGLYTMEDHVAWLEVYCLYVLGPGVLSPSDDPAHATVAKLIKLLRCSLLYFLREQNPRKPIPGVARTSADAHEALGQYAHVAEDDVDIRMCKPNMHSLRCRLAHQEQWRGPPNREAEFWVEGGVQQSKKVARDRSTSDPARVVAKDAKSRMTMDRARNTHPNLAAMETVLYEKVKTARAGANLDAFDPLGEADQPLLLGTGKELRCLRVLASDRHKRSVEHRYRCMAERALSRLLHDFPPQASGIRADQVQHCHMLLYTYADTPTPYAEVVHSRMYHLNRSRLSYNVVCHYMEGGDTTLYVCRVDFFVKAMLPGCPAVRFIVGDMFKLHAVRGPVGTFWQANYFGRADCGHWGVRFEDVLGKPVMALPPGEGVAYFFMYSRMSGQGRATEGEDDLLP